MAAYTGELLDEVPTGAGRGRVNPPAPMQTLTAESLASPQGKALIARQEEQMAATPTPSAPSAIEEVGPVAANIVKENAQQAFQSLTPDQTRASDVLAAGAAGYGIYRSLRDKMGTTPTPAPSVPIAEPTLTDNFSGQQPKPTLDQLREFATKNTQTTDVPQNVENRTVFTPEEHRIQRQQTAINQARQQMVGPTPVVGTPSITPETPTVTPETPAAPIELTKPVAPPEAPKQPSGPLMTGTGKPAFAGEAPPSEKKQRFKTEYSDISKVPKGYAFVPGAQSIDTARNDLGQETYTKEFSKRDFPKDYKEASAVSKEINRSLGRPTREEMLAKGIEPPKPTPGITQKISGYKLVKVAGITGALVAMSDIAKAASKGNYGEAAARSADLATDFIPGVGAAKTAFSGMGLNANEEEQLKQLQYRAMVGAGQGFRGIAPPSR